MAPRAEQASGLPAVTTDGRRAHPRKQVLAPREVFSASQRASRVSLRPALT